MRLTKEKVVRLSQAGYWVTCSVLFLFALLIVVFAIVNLIADFIEEGFNIYGLLNEVGFLIFAIALIDVCKYFVTEEILKKEEEKIPGEFRKAFTKFGIIMITALSLEGLILVIEVAQQNISYLLYPIGLLLIAIFYMIGIGIYQKLTMKSEQ